MKKGIWNKMPFFINLKLVLRAGIEPARPLRTQDFLTSYGFRRLLS